MGKLEATEIECPVCHDKRIVKINVSDPRYRSGMICRSCSRIAASKARYDADGNYVRRKFTCHQNERWDHDPWFDNRIPEAVWRNALI